jgi:hypothetical protein
MFLVELCNSKATPRVPKQVRETARWCLRHYPSEYDMKRVAETSPDVFAERMEDVTKLFKQYEQSKASKDEA